MLSDKMLTDLNEQITKEFYSAYLYLQMSAWFTNRNLPGFANWMTVQAKEEAAHATIFSNYVNDCGGMLALGTIDAPPPDYASPLDIYEQTLAHEQVVTASINDLMNQAIGESDHASKTRLDWFVSEQVEEEASAFEIIGKLKLIDDKGVGLFMLDKELAARVFVMPSPLAGA